MVSRGNQISKSQILAFGLAERIFNFTGCFHNGLNDELSPQGVSHAMGC
jgi:hypothetical protein